MSEAITADGMGKAHGTQGRGGNCVHTGLGRQTTPTSQV